MLLADSHLLKCQMVSFEYNVLVGFCISFLRSLSCKLSERIDVQIVLSNQQANMSTKNANIRFHVDPITAKMHDFFYPGAKYGISCQASLKVSAATNYG